MAARLLRPVPRAVFGTHGVDPKFFRRGFSYGGIDTATGYNNAVAVGKAITDHFRETGVTPYLITKFNTIDFKNGIDDAVKKHRFELGHEPDEVLLHSTLDSDEKNVAAIRKLRQEFPNSRIGASNMTLRQLLKLHQVERLDTFHTEYHVNFRTKLIERFCHDNKIVLYGFRPFHGLKNPVVQELAAKNNMTPDYYILYWLYGKGIIPVTSSQTEANIDRVAKWVAATNYSALDAFNSNPDDTNASTCMKKWTGKGWESEPFIV